MKNPNSERLVTLVETGTYHEVEYGYDKKYQVRDRVEKRKINALRDAVNASFT